MSDGARFNDRSSILAWQRQVSNSEESAYEVHTPSKSLSSNPVVSDELESIASNIKVTFGELDNIYSEIGYSPTEISTKKSDIFVVIQDTISNFTTNLQRERNNIESECEWMRQQIRIILAMMNDTSGEKNLSLFHRGIVFSNQGLLEEGYKEQTSSDISMMKQTPNQEGQFGVSSPFNPHLEDEYDDLPTKRYDNTSKNFPKLSLLQLKGKLNVIFLDTLKAFSQVFRKLNELALIYLSNKELIGDYFSPSANVSVLELLPSKEEAEEHKLLIDQFESSLKYLNLHDASTDLMQRGTHDDRFAFIIPSPKKQRIVGLQMDERSSTDSSKSQEISDILQPKIDGILSHLRDLNYQIVRVIRSLKFTKITQELLHGIQYENEFCDNEIEVRQEKIYELVSKCLTLIEVLQLSDDQLIEIQRSYDSQGGNANDTVSTEGYFDLDTLKFIRSNPKHFGLNDDHISYLHKFANYLQRKRDSKQKKYDNYMTLCRNLWEKLGENSQHIEMFLAANNSLTDLSLINFKMELNKLYLKRSEFIESFISDCRVQIEQSWNQLFYSEEERMCFKYFSYNAQSDLTDKETVLTEHETELARLSKILEARTPVLALYKQLNDLLQDQIFLKESSKDSSRLLSKNSCKILLHEEKVRKNINKNLPKLFGTLKSTIMKYNKSALENNEDTLKINGEGFFEKVLSLESEQTVHSVVRSTRQRPVSQTAINSAASTAPILTTTNTSGLRSPSKILGAIAQSRNSTSREIEKRKQGSFIPRTLSVQGNIRKKPTLVRNKTKLPERTFTNTGTIRLTNSLNSSLGVSVSSSTVRLPGNLGSFNGTHLHPLNRPLVSRLGLQSIANSKPKAYPLSTSTGNSLNSQLTVSPIRDQLHKGKENSSPIQMIKDKHFGESSPLQARERAPSRRVSTMTCDTSTLIGDDYNVWRDEQIESLNHG